MGKAKAKISATISGSFNKHLDKIQDKIRELQGEGIEVLSPKLSRPFSCEGRFVRLETDKGTPGEIEFGHLEGIARSDFLYVVNPGGYVGKSVALEIGYALSRGIPVYSLEKPEDFVLSFFVKPERSVKIIKRLFIARRNEISFPKKSLTMTDIQNYVRDMVERRGFEKETIEDVLLLMVEEIGELARAIRDLKGLKVSDKREDVRKNLKEELADCLIYLLDIANLARVSLEDALREKEKLNSARKWRSRED
jgi:NTP pyrophosphatase (non-canonical NTP hydrolase)